MIRRMSMTALALLLAAGCGKTEQQKQAEDAAKQVQQGLQQVAKATEQIANAGNQAGGNALAQGLQQMAQGMQQAANAQNIKTIDSEQLKTVVPDVGGWERGKINGETTSAMGFTASKADAEYTRGESRLEIEITDTSLNQLMLSPISMFMGMGFSEKTDDGFKRATKVAGNPGYEEWDASARRGEVTAVVANRYIVHAAGRRIDSLDVVRKAIESVDFAKLAALK